MTARPFNYQLFDISGKCEQHGFEYACVIDFERFSSIWHVGKRIWYSWYTFHFSYRNCASGITPENNEIHNYFAVNDGRRIQWGNSPRGTIGGVLTQA